MSQVESYSRLLSLETSHALCLDRRRDKRFPCHPDTTCLLTLDEAVVQARKIQNLSPGGAKLLLNQEVAGERLRTVGLYNPVRGYRCERAAWKVYTYACPDGVVVLGVAFAKELSPEELDGLL